MFDRLCVLLLRCYPAEFRRAYGDDALRLIRDRARHERGAVLRTRLLIDLAMDLFSTSVNWRAPAPAVLARIDGGPRFDFLEPHRPRPQAMLAGTLTSMLMLASFALLFQPRIFPPTPLQVGEGSGGEPIGLESSNSEQQVIVNGPGGGQTLVAAIAAKLTDRFFDAAIGQQLADALLRFEKNGRYTSAGMGRELAERITDDIDRTSHALGIPAGAFVADVVYSTEPLPNGPPPPMTTARREAHRIRMLEQNCLFRTIETLPRNIGYLKLDGFMEPSVCQETARRAMAAVNGADALVIDLQDNGGGMGETALQIAGYLFDRPAFLYDPRPNTPVPSHTASPIAGNALIDKPVYLLTSGRTASAAEYFVYNLKMLKRVTIVGTRTAGAMHAGAFHRIDDHFGMGIQETPPPDNPYPIKGWEVIGIEPHVLVPGADALDVARALAESRARRSR